MIVRDFLQVEPATSYDTPGVRTRWVIGKPEGAPNFAMRVIEVEPGAATPHHEHQWEHEVFVLEGEGIVKGPGGEYPLRPGTAVYVPPMERHQFANTGTSVLRFICVIPHLDSR